MQLAERAVETVERALGEGDSKAALTLLQGLGLLNGERHRIGADDPQTLHGDAKKLRQLLSLS